MIKARMMITRTPDAIQMMLLRTFLAMTEFIPLAYSGTELGVD